MTPNRTRLAGILTTIALALGACAGTDTAISEVSDTGQAAVTPSETGTAVEPVSISASAENQASHLNDGDLSYDDADVVTISLQGSSATSDDGGVQIDESTVTIAQGGVYSLAGTLTDGEVIVDVGDEDVTLVLDGIDITNTDGAAIAIMSADRASIVLAENASNRLADGTSYVFPDADTDEPNAALYSAADLTIAGGGQLTVSGNYNDGIASKDGLVIESGTIAVDAVDDGIRGKDYVIVSDGSIHVDSGGDAIKADNDEDADRGYVQINGSELVLVAGDDGVQAATDVIVTGGTITIDAGSVSGTGRALQGDVLVAIGGGVIDAVATDDAIHSNDTVTIGGGTLTLAAGDDGVHGDLAVTIRAGSITITEAYEGIEAEVITINDGDIDITSSDDGLNVASSDAAVETTTAQQGGRPAGRSAGRPGSEVVGDHYISIHGGTISITITSELAEQGDGIDANGHVEMTGGVVTVSGPTDTRNSALDYSGGTFVLSGGTLIGTNVDGRNSEGVGAGSTQPSLYLTTGATVSAGTVVEIVSPEGDTLVTFEPANDYSVVVFSSLDLVEGDSYDVYLGGELAGSATAAVSG